MGVRLTVKMKSGSGTDQTKTVLLDEEIITFGRDQTCQVVLAQQAVSRNHARISRDGTLFFLEDLGSSFGTSVNGQRIQGSVWTPVPPGAQLKFGPVEFSVRLE